MPCAIASFLKLCSQPGNVAGLAHPAARALGATAGAKTIAAARLRMEVTAEVEVEKKPREEGLRIASLCRWLMVSQGEGTWFSSHDPGVRSKGSFEGRKSKMRSGIGPSKAEAHIVTPRAMRGTKSSI